MIILKKFFYLKKITQLFNTEFNLGVPHTIFFKGVSTVIVKSLETADLDIGNRIILLV